MNTGLFPLITTEFVAKDDSIIRFELFNREVADVEDRNGAMSPGNGEWYQWYHANWRVPAEEPIVIEWASDKKDTIIGSTCTVVLVSPYDGALQTLYTTDPRLWCCLVSRKAAGGNDYSDVWFGWLDPEFYEEPFTAKKDYEVTLTFSDFGVLKRQLFAVSGDTSTISQIIGAALDVALPYSATDSTLVSTTTDGSASVLDGLKVRTDNFTDEDGEVSTWYDALEGTLRPLALRIEQRQGKVWVYDINAVVMTDTPHHPVIDHSVFDGEGVHDGSVYGNYWEDEEYSTWPIYYGDDEAAGTTGWGLVTLEERPAEPVAVEWASDDQTLAVDETFNCVKVTFSPYAEAVLFDGEKVDFETDYDLEPVKNGYGYNTAETYESFQLSFRTPPSAGENIGGITEITENLFKIKSLQGGDDCKGVIAYLGGIISNGNALYEGDFISGDGDYNYNAPQRHSYGYYGTCPYNIRNDIVQDGLAGSTLYKLRIQVPNLPDGANGQCLKIQIPMLYDGRYNPWEQADDDHNKLYKGLKELVNTLGLRLNIKLFASATSTTPLFYYSQGGFTWITGGTTLVSNLQALHASTWQTSAPSLPTFIMYNKFSGAEVDSEDNPCLGGLQDGGVPFNNRRKADYYFRKNNDGLYIPFPAVPTSNANYQQTYWLELEVTNGLYIYDKGVMVIFSGSTQAEQFLKKPIQNLADAAYGDSRWWLVGFPTITVVEPDHSVYEKVEDEDIEQSGVIDTNAAEELSIDTICGCCDSVIARGAYIDATTGKPVTALQRGTRTTTAEQLLIGTMYSQYAGRHLKLSGTARAVLPLEGLRLLTDSHYPDKRFFVTEETYNIIDGESEITMVEASADNYSSE